MSFVLLLWQPHLVGIDGNFMGRCYLIIIYVQRAHMVIPYVILVNLCHNFKLALYKWMKLASCAIGEAGEVSCKSHQCGKYGLAIKDMKWCSSRSPRSWAVRTAFITGRSQ